MLLNIKTAKNEDPLCTPPDPANLWEGGRQGLEAERTQQRGGGDQLGPAARAGQRRHTEPLQRAREAAWVVRDGTGSTLTTN